MTRSVASHTGVALPTSPPCTFRLLSFHAHKLPWGHQHWGLHSTALPHKLSPYSASVFLMASSPCKMILCISVYCLSLTSRSSTCSRSFHALAPGPAPVHFVQESPFALYPLWNSPGPSGNWTTQVSQPAFESSCRRSYSYATTRWHYVKKDVASRPGDLFNAELCSEVKPR